MVHSLVRRDNGTLPATKLSRMISLNQFYSGSDASSDTSNWKEKGGEGKIG